MRSQRLPPGGGWPSFEFSMHCYGDGRPSFRGVRKLSIRADGWEGIFPREVVRPQARETLDAGVRGAQLSNGRKAGAASFAAVQMKSKAGPAPFDRRKIVYIEAARARFGSLTVAL